MPVDARFQDVLNGLIEKPGRSKLEPYGELVDELCRRGLTCRDIAAVLAEKCQFQTSKSAVNNFMHARSKRRRKAARRIATVSGIAAPIASTAAIPDAAQKPSQDEVRKRIAAFKARKPVAAPSLNDFHFDPTQPLRLIAGEKPGPDK